MFGLGRSVVRQPQCVWIRYVCGETATGVFGLGMSVVRQPQVFGLGMSVVRQPQVCLD